MYGQTNAVYNKRSATRDADIVLDSLVDKTLRIHVSLLRERDILPATENPGIDKTPHGPGIGIYCTQGSAAKDEFRFFGYDSEDFYQVFKNLLLRMQSGELYIYSIDGQDYSEAFKSLLDEEDTGDQSQPETETQITSESGYQVRATLPGVDEYSGLYTVPSISSRAVQVFDHNRCKSITDMLNKVVEACRDISREAYDRDSTLAPPFSDRMQGLLTFFAKIIALVFVEKFCELEDGYFSRSQFFLPKNEYRPGPIRIQYVRVSPASDGKFNFLFGAIFHKGEAVSYRDIEVPGYLFGKSFPPEAFGATDNFLSDQARLLRNRIVRYYEFLCELITRPDSGGDHVEESSSEPRSDSGQLPFGEAISNEVGEARFAGPQTEGLPERECQSR